MRFRQNKPELPTSDHPQPRFQAYIEALQPLLQLADILGWPEEWLVCPSCSEFSWRIPPHIFEPCPTIVQMADSAGLKLDAERVQAIKVGITMDEQMTAFRKVIEEHFGTDGGEDDDE